jgi:hypothetical protein
MSHPTLAIVACEDLRQYPKIHIGEGSSSFLKKRTKKLLDLGAAPV